MGQIHPEIVAEHTDVFRIIGDEAATNIWCAVFFDPTKKFEDLSGLEMLDEVATINSVALASDLTHVGAPEELKNVDPDILNAEFFSRGNGLGVILHSHARDSFFLQSAAKKSATRSEIQDLRASSKVRNVPSVKIEHQIVGKPELIRIKTVAIEKIRFG
jgi:hypothetical protein